jgi:mRNA-degrading endonuclease RelE of RelBE toxin-antitoxin system
LRVGDLRVVYLIEETASLIVILRVARRSERTYRRIEG